MIQFIRKCQTVFQSGCTLFASPILSHVSRLWLLREGIFDPREALAVLEPGGGSYLEKSGGGGGGGGGNEAGN